jgi:hypothetical protein
MTVFENGHGWIQHAGGVGKLIEMRGPHRHTYEPARFYYRISRISIVRAISLWIASDLTL